LVVLRQLVHAQDRDDVLELLVLLQRGLHAARGLVVLAADHVRVELPRGRVQRVHGRVDAQRGDVSRQHDGGVEVGEGGRRDRKSTRLNSSHVKISYAVFCLKKKKKKIK